MKGIRIRYTNKKPRRDALVNEKTCFTRSGNYRHSLDNAKMVNYKYTLRCNTKFQ